MKNSRVAVVTGANRGLGLEACRQLARQGIEVILTARSEEKGRRAVEELKREGLNVRFHALDLASTESIERFAQWLEREVGRLDILINNAGILLDASVPTSQMKREMLREMMEANVYGPLELSEKLLPLMKRGCYGRIVNVSSGMGQLADMGGGYVAYRITKTALNVVTRVLAAENSSAEGTRHASILVNSVSPGWVKTDMGGPGGELTPEEGVDTIVWAATLPDDGPNGAFLEERKVIEW